MPLYEFQCEACGLVFERLVRGQGKVESHECRCGASAKRLLSKFGVAVSGPGSREENNPVLDKVVGEDADRRREYYKARHGTLQKLKKENPGKKIALREDRSFVVVDS